MEVKYEKIKKWISIILSLVMCSSTLTFNAAAINTATDTEISNIIKALRAIEYVKDQYDLADVDFRDLVYSDPILAYDYTEEGAVYNSSFIPILYEKSLIGWVIKAVYEGNVIYQFSKAFVSQTNLIADQSMEFAFIYDYNSSYLYDGNELHKLGDISIPVEKRSTLSNVRMLESSNIELNIIDTQYELQYIPDNISRAPVYYSCDVSFVSQNPPSNLCWAASVACIVNYFYDTSYTAVSVAKDWRNTTNYNEYNVELPLGDEDDVLRKYGITYTYKNEVPSDGVILNNILKGCPVLATFVYEEGFHDVVIYGINSIAGYLHLMDPEYGFSSTSYTASVGHTYVSGLWGTVATLDRATCEYWTA